MSAPGWLIVRAGGRRVGVDLKHVLEVADLGPVYPVPASEPAMGGVTLSRGRLVPLVRLAALLEGGGRVNAAGGTAVMVRLVGCRLCLEVDEAEAVLREPGLPVPEETSLPFVIAVARHPEGLVPLLDLTPLGTRMTEAASA